MRLRIFTEPQMGATYDELLAVARRAEETGFDAFFRSDHNALRRGVPRMSPALLSKRLHMLVRAGVVERWENGNRVTYQLSESGLELGPIVEALGRWGVRWIPELGAPTWTRTCSSGTSTATSTSRRCPTAGR